jgi:2-C-methyl-D-erythritol 2,4-cyclodiphosphate synthase
MEAEIANVDVTVIAQKPKLASYREAMRDNIAKLLDLAPGHVNVKATTTDHLGFIGRGEGICAMAIVAIATDIGGSPIEGAL